MISKHAVRAEVVTPDTLVSSGGHYEDVGSWVSGTTTIETNDFESSTSGWVVGTAKTVILTNTQAHTGAQSLGTFSDVLSHYIKKTVSGLTVGRTYRVSAWVMPVLAGATSRTAAIGVAGIGSSSHITATVSTWTQVTYTFTATTTSHEVRLYVTATSAGSEDVFWDDFALVATTQWNPVLVWQADPPTVVPGVRIPLNIEDATVSLDESWSPYAQVTLVCKMPSADVLAQIDPREGTRVQAWLSQRFGESQPLSALSAYRVPVRSIGAVERTNLILNPSFETTTTGWTGTNCTLARATTQAAEGTYSLALTPTTSLWMEAATAAGTAGRPVTAGSAYSVQALVRANIWSGLARLWVYWYDAAGVLVSSGYVAEATASLTAWTPLAASVVAPAGAAYAQVSVTVAHDGGPGRVHYLDAVMLEKASEVGSYFDGSNTDTNDSEYAWTGTAHASTSTWAPVTVTPSATPPTLASWSARYSGKMLASISENYGLGYNAFGTRASTNRSMDLTLVSREVDEAEGTLTLVCMSDEIRAQDAGHLSEVSTTPGGTSLVPAINLGLARISTALYAAVDDVTDLDPDALVWTPGTSVWDYMSNLVTSSERRLWCDELGAWRMGYPAAAGEGVLHVTDIRTASSDSLTTEGWYDGVVVEWRWTDGAGVDHVKYENAGPSDARKVFKATRDNKPWPRSGAAKTLLKWFSTNGRNVRFEAVSNYSATPGQVINVTLPDGTYASGVIQSITWNFPSDRMNITTRDLLEAPDGSWLEDAPGVSWDAIPVGIDWSEDI